MTENCPPTACEELRAENERLKDENHQLRLLLRPIEVNHAALEPHPDAQQPTPQGEAERDPLFMAALKVYRRHGDEVQSDEWDDLEAALVVTLNTRNAQQPTPQGETTVAKGGADGKY